MDTVWKTIPNFPAYLVSNAGLVKRAGKDARGHAPRILSPHIGNHGYEVVCLVKDGVRHRRLVHRLVCLAFHGEPPTPMHHVAHGDGTRRNNRDDNLRWATRSENMEDSRRHGTMALGDRHGRTTRPERTPRGEHHGHAKLTDADILYIRAADRFPGSGRALAATFGVSTASICFIRSGKTWKHVGKEEPRHANN